MLGPYELWQEIGRGGMATVFLARDGRRAGASQFVAIKRIHEHLAADPHFVELFIDEAQVASQISHPNVCHVFDYGAKGDTPYLAMEYLVGETLAHVRDVLYEREAPEFDAKHAAIIAFILADACEGLHAAHDLRNASGDPLEVVHRDVSPDNIFVTYDGFAKVVDFGTAKWREQRHDTAVGTIKGKLAYMQPEVLAGQPLDRRADVWGLGVITWELLTGRRLFRRHSGAATLHAVMHDALARPSSVRRGLPSVYDDVVLRALSRAPATRIATARAFGRALMDAAAAAGAVAHRSDVSAWLSVMFAAGERGTRPWQLRLTKDLSLLQPAHELDVVATSETRQVYHNPSTSIEDTVREAGLSSLMRDERLEELNARSNSSEWWRAAVIILLVVNTVLLVWSQHVASSSPSPRPVTPRAVGAP